MAKKRRAAKVLIKAGDYESIARRIPIGGRRFGLEACFSDEGYVEGSWFAFEQKGK